MSEHIVTCAGPIYTLFAINQCDDLTTEQQRINKDRKFQFFKLNLEKEACLVRCVFVSFHFASLR